MKKIMQAISMIVILCYFEIAYSGEYNPCMDGYGDDYYDYEKSTEKSSEKEKKKKRKKHRFQLNSSSQESLDNESSNSQQDDRKYEQIKKKQVKQDHFKKEQQRQTNLTSIYLEQLEGEEKNYLKLEKVIIKDFKKKMIYEPEKIYETLKIEITNQKKIRERKLRRAGCDIEEQVKALSEFERYLSMTLSRPDLAEIEKQFTNLLNDRHMLLQRHIKKLRENPVGHLFNRKIADDFYKLPIISGILKLEKISQKIRKTLLEKTREKQILKKEYLKNTKGNIQKVKDYFRKVGKYS